MSGAFSRGRYLVDLCDAHGLRRSQSVDLTRVAGVVLARRGCSCTRGHGTVCADYAKPTLADVRRLFHSGTLVAWRLPDGTRVLTESTTLPYPTPGLAPAVDWLRLTV